MSKANLKEVIERENFFRNFRDETELDIDNLTTEDANALYESIDFNMSPEHLHCDGEITVAQARAKARKFMGAVAELQKMGFAIPDTCWEIR